MQRPLIQIDDIGTSREMTEEEFIAYEEVINNVPIVPSAE
jgi:hypothetical protein